MPDTINPMEVIHDKQRRIDWPLCQSHWWQKMDPTVDSMMKHCLCCTGSCAFVMCSLPQSSRHGVLIVAKVKQCVGGVTKKSRRCTCTTRSWPMENLWSQVHCFVASLCATPSPTTPLVKQHVHTQREIFALLRLHWNDVSTCSCSWLTVALNGGRLLVLATGRKSKFRASRLSLLLLPPCSLQSESTFLDSPQIYESTYLQVC
jgi:hypothetical protein